MWINKDEYVYLIYCLDKKNSGVKISKAEQKGLDETIETHMSKVRKIRNIK